MLIGVYEDVINLPRREEIELRELFIGGMVEVNGRFVKEVEVRLELFIIDLSDFCGSVVDIIHDVIHRVVEC